jgi:glycosyltransferase involved in cell wall biosynthesis
VNPYRILYHHRIRAEDGQAVHVREMIGALRTAGHEVLESALVPKAQANTNGSSAASGSGFWHKLQMPRVATECAEILYSRKGTSMILRAARDFRPDFIYERHALHCRSALDASKRLGVPFLLEVNSPLCDEMAVLGLLNFSAMARKTERAVLAGADRVLPVSQVLADRLCKLGATESRIRVIRNGADPSRQADAEESGRELRRRLGMDNGQLVLGFVGYMRPWHRIELVLEAMARIARPEVHFVLAGSGPALPDLMQRVEVLGLTDRVHALGAVPRSHVPGICAAFDAAVVPAINDYASPLKMFDTLSAGVATLALDQPNIRELLTDGETGVLFVPGDVQSLSDRLCEFVDDRERLRAIGRAGREALIKNRWTWDGSAERVIQTYEELR